MKRQPTFNCSAETLSKNVPWISIKATKLLMEKCEELDASGFFLTLEEEPGGWPSRTYVHFVKQPSHRRFEEIQESMNPQASPFTWSEVMARFELKGESYHRPELQEPLMCCVEGCDGRQDATQTHMIEDRYPGYACNKCGRLHFPDGIGAFINNDSQPAYLCEVEA